MYRKILVPLDGSDRAEVILPHVIDLASCYGASVIFLQVIEPHLVFTNPYDFYPDLNTQDIEEHAGEAEAYLVGLEERLHERGIETTRRVEYGSVVATILDVAEEEEVDLIAMASHGRGKLAQVFYGSVAAGVLQRVDRPLLLIRA